MTEQERPKGTGDAALMATATAGPMVFISHDSRDAKLAEAFAKLLKNVSAGMIKTFRSSDNKGKDGIDFGAEWYGRLMGTLQSTSDVVCLFTDVSLGRPWILFEAGVAKGRSTIPVIGVALGIPLARVNEGPFYQFQNTEDSDEGLAKLLRQLASRIAGLELVEEVVQAQIRVFKTSVESILRDRQGQAAAGSEPTEDPVSKVLEEVKSLPARLAEVVADSGEMARRRRWRRSPAMLMEIIERTPDDPIAILMVASFVRDDIPWLYELCLDAYRAARSGDAVVMEREARRFQQLVHYGPGPYGPGMDALGFDPEASFFVARAVDELLGRMASQCRRSPAPRRVAPVRSRPANVISPHKTPTEGRDRQHREETGP